MMLEIDQQAGELPGNSQTDFLRAWQERVLEPRLAKFEAHILSMVGGGPELRGSRPGTSHRTKGDYRYRESDSFL